MFYATFSKMGIGSSTADRSDRAGSVFGSPLIPATLVYDVQQFLAL